MCCGYVHDYLCYGYMCCGYMHDYLCSCVIDTCTLLCLFVFLLLAPNSKGNNSCSFTIFLRLSADGSINGGGCGQPIEQMLDGTGVLIVHHEATFLCTANITTVVEILPSTCSYYCAIHNSVQLAKPLSCQCLTIKIR